MSLIFSFKKCNFITDYNDYIVTVFIKKNNQVHKKKRSQKMAVNTEKIKLNKFGIRKTVNVRTTFGLLEKLDELDITLLELQDTENAEYIDIRRNNLKSARLKMEFVQAAFELSDEDIENIKNSISPEQFGEAFEYVTLRMRGVTDENYNVLVAEAKREQEEQEAEETDPKEDSVE